MTTLGGLFESITGLLKHGVKDDLGAFGVMGVGGDPYDLVFIEDGPLALLAGFNITGRCHGEFLSFGAAAG